METSKEATEHIVNYLLGKLTYIEQRKKQLEVELEKKLTELRQEGHSYKKMLQDVCPHSEQVKVNDWDYHNNVDDSHNECKICGKHL